VLDNCEHVVDRVAELAGLLLRTTPGLRILATSREPLGLAGEVLWDVPPLVVPPQAADTDPATLQRSSAVRLFVARATAAARSFTLDPDTGPAVAVLCRRLDGIPLALELAATRVRALGVHGVVARLDDRFRLLAGGRRDADARQQTLAAVIDWSWQLLTEPERIVLRRLAVHTDGCTLQAAEVVCAGDDIAATDVLDLLGSLVDRSLVLADHADDTRYRLLESVAAYCVDRLHEADEIEQVQHRHHRYYTDLARRAEPHLYGPQQRQWLLRLDAEAGNLRNTFDDALMQGSADRALRMAVALTWYWFLRGRLAEARRSLAAASALPGEAPADVRARAVAWHAGISLLLRDAPGWAARREATLRLVEDIDDPVQRARAQWFLGLAEFDLGDLPATEDLLNRALATFRTVGDRWGTAAALSTRAQIAHIRGDLTALERDAAESAELFGVVGDRWGQLQTIQWLGGLAELTGDYEQATRLQRDRVRIAEELRLWPEIIQGLSFLGWIALQLGDHMRARDLCEQAVRLATEYHLHSGQSEAVFAVLTLGVAARRDGKLDIAETHLFRLRDLARRAGTAHAPYLPIVLVELGFAAELRGDPAAARALHLEAITVARQIGDPRFLAYALEGLAAASATAGSHKHAAHLLGAAAAARRSAAVPPAPAEREEVNRAASAARAALGAGPFAAVYERGGTLTPDEALAVLDQDHAT
jgi:predicted ATPase